MKKPIFALVLLLSVCFANAQSLVVEEVLPARHSLDVYEDHEISITFDQAVNPSTVTDETFMIFGRWSGPMVGDLSFTDDDHTIAFSPSAPFMNGETIMVSLTSSIQSASGVALDGGHTWHYWTRTQPGYMIIPQVGIIEMKTEDETWIQSYGAYAGDINDDDHSDLVVVNEYSEDIRILLNDGTGNFGDFVIQEIPESTKPSTNEGADFNHDGLIDLAIGSTQGPEVTVLMGNGDGTFQDEMTLIADEGVRGLAVL
ncbi:MAG: hypothetical protein HKN32_06305, partial [Flavobacteriales bacterium]|nr:hypothetical protein [Flavobacteriales bacterium]